MLGKYVRVKIDKPIGSNDSKYGFKYPINFGYTQSIALPSGKPQPVYVMGIKHSIRDFNGRVIAVIHHKDDNKDALVVAPKSSHYIINEIVSAVEFREKYFDYSIECLYERSCGAVVFRKNDGKIEYLLIKNKRSTNWGFPKGHIEKGESEQETAVREVLEETGAQIKLLPDFSSKSQYLIQGKIEKAVTIFLAETDAKEIKIQREEIEDYKWETYETALSLLKFENDKSILKKAYDFLKNKGYFNK